MLPDLSKNTNLLHQVYLFIYFIISSFNAIHCKIITIKGRNVGVSQSLSGMRPVFHFYGVVWRQYDCVFRLGITRGDPGLEPAYLTRNDGGLDWPGRKMRTIDSESE